MEKKIKILMCLVCLGLLVNTASVTAQAAPAVVSVSPSSVEESHGQTFTVIITVDPKGNEICAAQYVLYFDQRILNATLQSQGTFLSQDGAETFVPANIVNNSIGKIEYGESRTGEGLEHGVTTSGTLASITFEVIGTSGRSDFKLSDVILVDQNLENLETESKGGICTIGNVAGEPIITDSTVEEVYAMIETNPEEIILLDVRTEGEYNAEHLEIAGVELKHIPLSELEKRLGELDPSKKLIVYSKNGADSRTASEILAQHGFGLVYNMLGGIDEWRIKFPVSIQFVPTPAITVDPTPDVSPVVLSTPGEKGKLPGFEVVFAIMGLLAISYILIKNKSRGKIK